MYINEFLPFVDLWQICECVNWKQQKIIRIQQTAVNILCIGDIQIPVDLHFDYL